LLYSAEGVAIVNEHIDFTKKKELERKLAYALPRLACKRVHRCAPGFILLSDGVTITPFAQFGCGSLT
jgi:hypothetical protein